MEGNGVGSGGCVVHFDVHWRVSYVVGCCNVVAILSMADMVCLDCMQKLQCMSNASYAVKPYCC